MGLTPRQDWLVPLYGGQDVLDVNLKRDGDAFVDCLFEAMEEVFPGTGRAAGSSSGTEMIPGTHHIWELASRGVRSQIALQPTDKGRVRIFITGDGEQHAAEVAAWKGVVTGARARLTDASRGWSWVAYIAQSTGSALQAQVAGEHEIGDVLIVGAGEALARPMPSPWDLRSTSLNAQQLIAVCGRSAASSWEDAERDAYATARLAAGLLAVLWDVPFGVVQDPRHVRNPGQDGKPERPIAFPTTDEKLDDDGLEVTDLSTLPEFTVPAEVASSWAKLIGSEDLRRAVIAFQEGLSLLERHTSYASLAFVAIIESLATGPVKKCEECKQVTGSTARFRDALAPLVGTDAARLLARMYDKRSRTAHDGVLHGLELLPAMSFPRFLSDDAEFDFRQEVEFLRFACKIRLRELLALPNLPHPAMPPHAADGSQS
jgi:hypothetical protein